MTTLRFAGTFILLLLLVVKAPTPATGRACDRVEQEAPSEVNYDELRKRAQSGELTNVLRADRFVQTVFRTSDVPLYETAAEVYSQVLLTGETASSDSHAYIVRCHRAQLALIAPEDLGQGGDSYLGDPTSLLAWIRAQDPRPSTPLNERVVEHLHRVAVATAEYGDEQSATGVDARGEVYIRLGKPFRTTSVQFNSSRVLQVIRDSPILTRSDFPVNQYWVYPSLSEYADYIFYRDGRTWKIGEVQDLIPSFYRSGMGSNPRGFERAGQLSILLQEVYSQLSTINLDYSPLYQEAESVAAPTLTGGSRMSRIRRMVSKGRRYDRDRAFRREEEVPRQYTTRPRTETAFPVSIRTARFQTPSGETRTDVYWGLTPETVADAPESALRFSTVQYASSFDTDTAYVRQYQIPARDGGNTSAVVAPVLTADAADTSGPYHLAFQWDWYRPSDDESMDALTSLTTVARVDTLQTLTTNPAKLEMSDLMATFVPNDPAAIGRENLRPYPFAYISPEDGFGVYFEVYNLVFNAEDKSRYSVTYTFRERSDDGGWISISDDDVRTTSTATTTTGSSRRADEFIIIDPDQLRDLENVERLQVVVRVKDEVSGQEVEREIEFEYGASLLQ